MTQNFADSGYAIAKDANSSARKSLPVVVCLRVRGRAAANRPDDALQYLQKAVNRGYKDADALMADNDPSRQPQVPATRRCTKERKARKLKFN
jgi:hypothetical protein